jgi:adenine-specific DNA methylase
VSNVSQIKDQFLRNKSGKRMLAVIEDSKKGGKVYRLPYTEEMKAADVDSSAIEYPQEPMATEYTQALPSCTWGVEKWSDLFTDRQLMAVQTLVKKHNDLSASLENDDYNNAVLTYLGILVDRIAMGQTSYGRWDKSRENLATPFSKQAIPMMFDFPEGNIFSKSTGSFSNSIAWVIKFIQQESSNSFPSVCRNSTSGEKSQFEYKEVTATITDPPYYDAVSYADLSDFFYVWLKRTLSNTYPLTFATPLTPKNDECTALAHRHNGNKEAAYLHFESKLQAILNTIQYQTSEIVSVMFAHQSTQAWTTLCNSILGAQMNITGSWAIDTELSNRSTSLAGAALSSSVTLACKPVERAQAGSFKKVKDQINETVKEEVSNLYQLGFRGADLLTACFGKAVSVFGGFQAVEKASGDAVTVKELLQLARESAFQAIISDIQADEETRFYIGWCNLFGFGEAEHDDVRRITQIGLNIDISGLERQHILLNKRDRQTLAQFRQRIRDNENIGNGYGEIMLNQIHKAMKLFESDDRESLVNYLSSISANDSSSFWRVLTSLTEVLPGGSADYQVASELLANQSSLTRAVQQAKQSQEGTQESLNL